MVFFFHFLTISSSNDKNILTRIREFQHCDILTVFYFRYFLHNKDNLRTFQLIQKNFKLDLDSQGSSHVMSWRRYFELILYIKICCRFDSALMFILKTPQFSEY